MNRSREIFAQIIEQLMMSSVPLSLVPSLCRIVLINLASISPLIHCVLTELFFYLLSLASLGQDQLLVIASREVPFEYRILLD